MARDVKRSGGNVALVSIRFHAFGAWELTCEIVADGSVNPAVCTQKRLRGRPVDGGVGFSELLWRDETGRRKILVTGGLGLTVPERLVLDFCGCDLRDSLEAENNVAEVCYGSVAVLEIEVFQ